MKTKYFHHFSEADFEDKERLGGKGSGLARMTQAGYPVPNGFTIDTDACSDYLSGAMHWPSFVEGLYEAMAVLETETGMRYGGSFNEFPLLVSVRSGAPVSMPGMMETILNAGITSKNLPYMGDPRFSLSLYCDFLGVYGRLVLGQASRRLSDPEGYYRAQSGLSPNVELTREQLEDMVVKTRARALRERDETDVSSAQSQLERSIKAVFESSGGHKAMVFKKHNGLKLDMGTAVNVVAMVYGNRDENSGTGDLYTRNPSTGEKKLYGEWLPRKQGEKLVSGLATPLQLDELKYAMPAVYDQLEGFAYKLETGMRAPQEVEFTVDGGKLWLLQHRSSPMTAKAQVVSAVDMTDEGLINKQEAVERVGVSAVKHANVPTLNTDGATKIGTGLAASPGTAVGRASISGYLSPDVNWADDGIILIRPLTSPEDVAAMLRAKAFATGQGGTTSHAGSVARSENKPCVVGIGSWAFGSDFVRVDGEVLFRDGDLISLDGGTGEVYLGALKLDDVNNSSAHVTRMSEWQKELGAVKVSKKHFDIGLAHWTQPDGHPDLMPKSVIENQIAHWWPELDLRLDLTKIVADFYLLSEAARVNPDLQRTMDGYAEVLAKEVALYLDAACGGELRHRKGGFEGLSPGDRGLARREWRATRMEKGLNAVTVMTDTFNSPGSWPSHSYGGKRWGQASSLLDRFLRGEMMPATFVDMAFDLQHNGGCIFNKLQFQSSWGFGWNLDNLKSMLDTKLYGDFDSLRTAASKSIKELFDLKDSITSDNVTIGGLQELGEVWVEKQSVGNGQLMVGSSVVIKYNTRSKDLRGRMVKVKRIRELHKDGCSVGMFVYFTLDGKERYAAVKNVLPANNSEERHRSYFNG